MHGIMVCVEVRSQQGKRHQVKLRYLNREKERVSRRIIERDGWDEVRANGNEVLGRVGLGRI